ncbi:MAG: ribosome-associated protein [Gammaproteobacteria bacterium]|jgi:ribosome-associated protein
MKVVTITKEPVELYKILKFEGLSSSGAEAKIAVAGGRVQVNGLVELRKRKKIIAGDTIEFENEKFQIQFLQADNLSL